MSQSATNRQHMHCTQSCQPEVTVLKKQPNIHAALSSLVSLFPNSVECRSVYPLQSPAYK
jgi:hypothetical protein